MMSRVFNVGMWKLHLRYSQAPRISKETRPVFKPLERFLKMHPEVKVDVDLPQSENDGLSR